VVSGKASLSPEMAHGLGDAFGSGAQVWMNLDTTYRLWPENTARRGAA